MLCPSEIFLALFGNQLFQIASYVSRIMTGMREDDVGRRRHRMPAAPRRAREAEIWLPLLSRGDF
jgi:hypothetical protein